MTAPAPLSHPYNLGRLGNAGDRADFAADAGQRAAIAAWSDVLSVERFAVTADIAKLGPSRFRLDYRLEADVTQACVVTLEPMPAHVAREFTRELHFTGNSRNPGGRSAELIVDPGAEEGPENIENLHYDLAGPALEEYSLALDPYPRRPGVRYAPEADMVPDSPFAVLKGLKKGR